MATPRTLTPEQVQALRGSSGVSGAPRTLTPEQVAQIQGKPYTPALKVETPFVNQADQDMYAKKQAQYQERTDLNKDLYKNFRPAGQEPNTYEKILSVPNQIMGGFARVGGEFGTGLRRLLAKQTNRLGFSDSLDPNSPSYNPILDRKSATSQLAKEKSFKGQTGLEKFGKTLGDVVSFAAPSVGAESIALKAPAAADALRLFGGDAAGGRGFVKALTGKNVADIPGKLGTLADTFTTLASNMAGGLAQTAVREGGVSGKDFGDTLKGSLIAHGIFSTLPGTLSFAKQVFKPNDYAREFIEKYPNKTGEFIDETKQFLKDTLPKGFLRNIRDVADVEKFDNGLKHAATYFMSGLKKTKDGIDTTRAYQSAQETISDLGEMASSKYSKIAGSQKIFDADDIVSETVAELKKKGITTSSFFADAFKDFMDVVENKLAATRGSGSRKISAKQLAQLRTEISKLEFAKSGSLGKQVKESVSEEDFNRIADAFREVVGKRMYEEALQRGGQSFANEMLLINNEIASTFVAKDIIKNMTKDPTAVKKVTDHMFGLLSGMVTGNPLLYAPGRLLSKLSSEAIGDYKFNKIVQNPIFDELAKKRTGELAKQLQTGVEDISSYGPAKEIKLPKTKISDLVNVNKSKAPKLKNVKTKLSDIVKNKKK